MILVVGSMKHSKSEVVCLFSLVANIFILSFFFHCDEDHGTNVLPQQVVCGLFQLSPDAEVPVKSHVHYPRKYLVSHNPSCKIH